MTNTLMLFVAIPVSKPVSFLYEDVKEDIRKGQKNIIFLNSKLVKKVEEKQNKALTYLYF